MVDATKTITPRRKVRPALAMANVMTSNADLKETADEMAVATMVKSNEATATEPAPKRVPCSKGTRL